jgi:predicted Zn-dependent protease
MESKVLALSRKYDCDFELYSESASSTDIKIEGKKLESKKASFSRGFSIRCIKDGRVGFSFFEQEEKLGEAAEKAILASKSSTD